jgi:simple sugar transport system ATP-binding protein
MRIRELHERGDVPQIVIAHNSLHVLETCDRVSLLQNGHITFDRPTAETSIKELLMLVGVEYREPGT